MTEAGQPSDSCVRTGDRESLVAAQLTKLGASAVPV